VALRKTIIASGQYYHIFNRGVARNPIFFSNKDYERFLFSLNYYQYKDPPVRLSYFLKMELKEKENILQELRDKNQKIISILCYSLMPNHYHLLLKQEEDFGIENFICRAVNGYVKYLNIKNKRVGPLFQGAFKAVRVETDEQMIHLSRYIHLNPVISYLVKPQDILNYKWTSLGQYLTKTQSFIDKSFILNYFGNKDKYFMFIKDFEDYKKRIIDIEYLTLDKDFDEEY